MKAPRGLFYILALGFALRVWGISFGLPDLYHADEPIVVNHALAYGTGDFHPHFFKIPPLVSYLLFAAYGVYFVGARAVGGVGGIHDFETLFLTDPSSFYLIARFLFGALLGTLTLLIFYQLIAKNFSEGHGLLSSFFLAAAFLHVRDSHYIYVDIPLLAVLLACFFFIFRILERGERRDYFLFGILAGAAVATKYNGVFVFVPFIVAHLFQKKFNLLKTLDGNLIGAFLFSLVSYGLLNPFSWLDGKFFFKELSLQGGSQGYAGFFHHLRYSLGGGLGWSLLALALGGSGVSLFFPERKRMVFLSFVAFYYCPVLVFFSQPYDRYALPLVPFLVFFAADLLIAVSQRMSWSRGVLFAVAFVVALPSLAKITLSNQLFSRQDVRTVAREWIEANLPSESRMALDTPFYMPRLKPTVGQLEEKREILSKETAAAKLKRINLLLEEAKRNPEEKRFELHFLKDQDSAEDFLLSRPSVPYRVEELKRRAIQYVIVARIHPDDNPAFYDELRKEAKLIARLSPYKDRSRSWPIDREPLTGSPLLWRELISRERNGQIIEVYRLR